MLNLPVFSILLPTYKSASIINPTLESILSQSFKNYELIISEDCSGDNIEEVVNKIGDPRIRFFRTDENLGYPRNLEFARTKARGEYIYLMGQDDILGEGAIQNTLNAFSTSKEIGAVTRPYFWFDKDIRTPVRAKKQLNPNKDEILTMQDPLYRLIRMFSTLDQLSGLGYRAKFFDIPFHPDIFPCHVYPFASIFKKHPVVFLKDYNVAVRIYTSQTRSLSSIYNKSPVQSWAQLFENVYPEKEFNNFREGMIKNFVAVNYVGLVQIKNYARYRYLLREIWYLIKYRVQNIWNPAFWFFALGTIVVPRQILIPLVDWYKRTINSSVLKNIKFKYVLKK